MNKANYKSIEKYLEKPTKKAYVIDDSQYLMAFEMFDRAKETGYNKFTDIALDFRNLIQYIVSAVPDDVIVCLSFTVIYKILFPHNNSIYRLYHQQL